MRKGLARPVVDGGDLCSPGRWPLSKRRFPSSTAVLELRTALWQGYMASVAKFERGCARRVLIRGACAQRDSFPFHDSDPAATREALRAALKSRGFDEGRPRPEDPPQNFEVRLIGELAKACGDPARQRSSSERRSGDWPIWTPWPSPNGGATMEPLPTTWAGCRNNPRQRPKWVS